MPKYLKWAMMAMALWRLGIAQNGGDSTKSSATSGMQKSSAVIFVSAKQMNAELYKQEIAPGTFRFDLTEYSPEKGGADVLRRTKPGSAEVHKHLIDFWYVIRGEGVLVTGGSLSDLKEIEPNELRGPGITGGEERHIAIGDFVRIPAGVPHWLRKIEGNEFVYMVVKTPE